MPGDILTMSDEDFLKSAHEMPELGDPVNPEDPTAPAAEPPMGKEMPVPEQTPEAEEQPIAEGNEAVPVAEEKAEEGGTAAEPTPPGETQEIDYKTAYESIVGRPFKANGKEIKVTSPEEAIQLMQMGAGYHKKMSQLGYANRIIETLRENDLLDENKINNLIDISRKNPEAIAALVRSAGIEPHQLDLDGDDAPQYTPGNHVLPEDQVRFRNSVENIREQGGTEFLNHVAQDWDVTSRAEIFKDPRALDMLFEHKQSGVYDKVYAEIERRRMFDPSLSNMPLIHTYLAVGNEMNQRGLLGGNPQPAAPVAPSPTTPVAVRSAATPQPVAPNPAAARAASVRSTPTPANTVPNYLTMSDEEFMKNHRVF